MNLPLTVRRVAQLVWLALFAAPAAGQVHIDVPGTANPWLAGMPAGSFAGQGCVGQPVDTAPAQSPVDVGSLELVAGSWLELAAEGTSCHGQGHCYGSDGGGSACRVVAPENGIAGACAPYCSLIGVFLDDDLPTRTPAPPGLDFRPPESREYHRFAPGLKQPFFIGNGRRSDGGVQQIAVPAGATRFFVGTMDTCGWRDNSGVLGVSVTARCRADCDRNGVVDSEDFFVFMLAFFSDDPSADLSMDGSITSADFFDFLTAFFAGCP